MAGRLWLGLLAGSSAAAFALACQPQPGMEVDLPPTGVAAAAGLPPFTIRGRWDDARALRVRVLGDGGPVASATLSACVESALSAWSVPGVVGFAPAGETEPADIVVRWATDAEAAQLFRDTSVAVTGRPGSECTVRLRRNAAWDTEGGPSLESVVVHEIGHALGLGHVEDERSAMHPQHVRAASAPGPGDRHGLLSLYADGPPSASDDAEGNLSVLHGDDHRGTLYGVAPPDRSDWALFDTDGDGDAELLVWATGSDGHGALTQYDFEPLEASGPPSVRLRSTRGPHFGVGGPGVHVVLLSDADLGRCLASRGPDGPWSLRRFDERGRPLPVALLDPALRERLESLAGPPREGDLDGDGTLERIVR